MINKNDTPQSELKDTLQNTSTASNDNTIEIAPNH